VNATQAYLDFLKEHGRPLSEINPGSDEYALRVQDALQAIKLLDGTRLPIVGGDILSESNGELVYAYQLWGDRYHTLNWSCDPIHSESVEEYINRSVILARECINKADEIALKLGKVCYVVLVV